MSENNNSLFSDEVLDELAGGSLFTQEKQGPVTVLGKTFENEEERRAYFREELRKKLPELKHIEGFPFGADDDIVNLSDPPYYTACPNPWLNDLTQEWEEEKKALLREGKRTESLIVREPYAADVSEGKSNPIYTAHSYHTKVPHPAIMRYILHYTQPGDIVFDGFCGTAMTGVAAQACGDLNAVSSLMNSSNCTSKLGARHAICADLSPIASFIGYNFNSPVEPLAIRKEIERIVSEMDEEYGWMYTTIHDEKPIGKINCIIWSDKLVCPNCGKEFVFWDAAVDFESKCMLDDFTCPKCGSLINKKSAKPSFQTFYDEAVGETLEKVYSFPVLVVYTVNGKRYQRKAVEYDLELVKKVEEESIKYPFPATLLPEGAKMADPKSSHRILYSHQFFTKRSLIAVSALNHKIEKSKYPAHLKFILTGMLTRCTVMSRVHINNFFHGGGGWNVGLLNNTLYVPSAPVETSVIDLLKSRVATYLRTLPHFPKEYGNSISVCSATNCLLKDNSIDYIFVDPPFGANINYSELNFLQEDWLGIITNNSVEAIENPSQGKNQHFYQEAMINSFKEFYRILKPNHWITIEFSNTSASIWNIIQYALQGVGFVVANVAGLDKKQGSFNAVTSTTAVKQDLVITCYKPSDNLLQRFDESNNISQNIWDFIDEYLAHLPIHIIKGSATTTVIERNPKILYDRLISYYVQHGYPVPIDATLFQKGLKERYIEIDGMYFTASQASEYEEKKKHTSDFVPMGLIVSNEAEGIQWLKVQLQKSEKTYQEIQPEWMQAINGLRKGDILPELATLLEENFIQNSDGRWRIANIQDDIDKEALRTKALLKEFKLYVEQASKPKAKIKEVRVEAVRAGFKQCYIDKDFQTIVTVGDKIPQNLLTEDEILLQFYDIASNHI